MGQKLKHVLCKDSSEGREPLRHKNLRNHEDNTPVTWTGVPKKASK